MGVPDSIKKKLAETTSKGGGAFLGYGMYLLMVKKWFFFQGYEGISDIHEFVILRAEKKIVQEGDKKVDREPNPVGSLASHVIAYHGNSKTMAEQKTTEFFLALFGITDDEISGDDKVKTIDECTGETQPCKGMIIGCDIYPKEKRNTKGEWLALPNFMHIAKPNAPGENSAEAAVKRWAEYEVRMRQGAPVAAAQ